MNMQTTLRRFVFGTCGLLCTAILSAINNLSEPYLVLDVRDNDYKLPKHFRSCQDALRGPATEDGLRQLRIAGSGQFSENELKTAIKQLNLSVPCYIVDLRQECHGYVNGLAISWYARHNAANFGKSVTQILDEERRKFDEIRASGKIFAHLSKPGRHAKDEQLPIDVHSSLTEEAVAKALSLHYMRLPVTDHLAPEPVIVDRFLAFVKPLPKDAWLYFHCRGGNGRTSTFMAMYDMMHNAKKISFEEIILRQWALGGSDLSHMPKKFNWRAFHKEERYHFLQRFYNYCQASDASFSKSFTEWLESARIFPLF